MRILKFALLDLRYDLQAIQQEVRSLVASEPWHPHHNQHGYEGEWTVLSLRSAGGEQKTLAEALNGEAYANTSLMDRCPSIKQLADQLACEKGSIRLLHLAPGASIAEHRDLELCFENGEARLHFPLFTNPAVEFFIEDERVYMRAGECWYLNANLRHRVANKGKSGRIHLVIDCTVNDWLRSMFCDRLVLKEEITEEEMTLRNEPTITRTIDELRRQVDNPAAGRLAAKMELQLADVRQKASYREAGRNDQEDVLSQLIGFIRSLGIEVKEAGLNEPGFLPGVLIKEGCMIIDRNQLQYPGDLLHEAGHIAVSPAIERPRLNAETIAGSRHREAEEMMAIAWSYAACRYLKLDPSLVFHEGGYQGGGQSILENFEQGHFFGTPMLEWCGMTRQPPAGGQAVDCFPRMIRWMRA